MGELTFGGQLKTESKKDPLPAASLTIVAKPKKATKKVPKKKKAEKAPLNLLSYGTEDDSASRFCFNKHTADRANALHVSRHHISIESSGWRRHLLLVVVASTSPALPLLEAGSVLSIVRSGVFYASLLTSSAPTIAVILPILAIPLIQCASAERFLVSSAIVTTQNHLSLLASLLQTIEKVVLLVGRRGRLHHIHVLLQLLV